MKAFSIAVRGELFVRPRTRLRNLKLSAALSMFLVAGALWPSGHASAYDGWQQIAKREAVSPDFAVDSSGGPSGNPCLILSSGARHSVDGAWVKEFPLVGGRHYRFKALRKTVDVAYPRRSALVKLTWQDDQGNLVEGADGIIRPEHPRDRQTVSDGWVEVSDTYWVPKTATRARVELTYRWSRSGSVSWSSIGLEEVSQAPRRKVRLATIPVDLARLRELPSTERRFAEFAIYVADAARKGADLVCLPESATYAGSGRTFEQVAEPIPGPSTRFFSQLSRKHDLYIVVGLTEKDQDVLYNTAVMTGPEGQLVGKYRKVCLPREEIAAGLTPGSEYPVFSTRFGKVGMMICWDVFFPEVTRQLSVGGAEVVAMPIWGGYLTLAKARALENQVYLITSTYHAPQEPGLPNGIFGPKGELLAEAERWGDAVVVEVDLDERNYLGWLGDMKARIERERPVLRAESVPKSQLDIAQRKTNRSLNSKASRRSKEFTKLND